MSIPPNVFYQCERPDCRFRFPITNEREQMIVCPICHSSVSEVSRISSERPRRSKRILQGHLVEALLDNIRSVYNVGSMFRTADGAGIRHMHLCGITTTPDHPRVGKTALGAERAVHWTHNRNSLDAALALQAKGFHLWAIEDSPEATPLFKVASGQSQPPVVMVFGNEIAGIDPDILSLCERVLWIPMQGQKRSLNVAVAFGIAAYYLRYAS